MNSYEIKQNVDTERTSVWGLYPICLSYTSLVDLRNYSTFEFR